MIPNEYRDLYEELAALIEFDAGVPREQAEETAKRMIHASILRQTSEQFIV